MAVAYDTAGPSSAGAGASSTRNLSWTHPAGGANRAVLVGVAYDDTSDASWSPSCTCATNPMDLLATVHSNNGTSGILAVFGIANQGSGTLAIAATVTGGNVPDDLEGGSLSFTGADLSSPFGAAQTNAGAPTTTPSKTGVTAAAASVIAGFWGGGDNCNSATSPGTSRFIKNQVGGAGYSVGNAAGQTSPGPGPVTVAWGTASAPFAIICIEVRATAGDAAVTGAAAAVPAAAPAGVPSGGAATSGPPLFPGMVSHPRLVPWAGGRRGAAHSR